MYKLSFIIKLTFFLLISFIEVVFCQIKIDSSINNSNNTNIKDTAYRKKYTFAEADSLISKSEYEKAVWFYINLYPIDPKRAVDSIRRINVNIKNIVSLVRKSFAIYAPFDPYSSNITSGLLEINSDNFKKKAKWADYIIKDLEK